MGGEALIGRRKTLISSTVLQCRSVLVVTVVTVATVADAEMAIAMARNGVAGLGRHHHLRFNVVCNRLLRFKERSRDFVYVERFLA